MPLLTTRLAVLVAVGATAQFVAAIAARGLSPWILAAWLTASVALMLADWFTAPTPDLVGFERAMPPIAVIGQESSVSWKITNPLDRPLRVAVADDLAPSLTPTVRRRSIDLPALATAEMSVPITPSRRGLFTPTEVVVRCEGRLGLAARQRARFVPGELRVHPSFRSRKEAELRINRARVLHPGVRSTRLRGSGTEFDQLREYTVDDESRRVDWAATARAGRPIVKTFRAERNQTVVNLLDSGRVMAGRVEGVPRLEHAMDAVMTLTALSTGVGDRCGLVIFDKSVGAVVAASNRKSQLGAVTSAMFAVEPALVESDYRSAFAATLGRFHRRTMLVIHTDLVEEVVADTLIPALPLVVKTHLVVVAASSDPDVIRWADGPVANGDDARRRAAAIVSLNDRKRAAARLRSLGATVVEAPVGTLPGRLADVYLQAKATGRL